MRTAWLSPSVMCIPAWQSAQRWIAELEACGVPLMHADVMDGEFVPNLMLGTDNIRNLRKVCHVPIDLHLMIQRPEDKLGWFDIQAGDYVSVHAESTRHLQRTLALIRDMGAHPAVALNPGTPVCMIEDVLDDVDMALVMTVNPGFAGQKLVPHTIRKIAALRGMLDRSGHSDTRIEADGNVSFENAPQMFAAGADVLVCGTSSVFHKGGTITENMARLKASLLAVKTPD